MHFFNNLCENPAISKFVSKSIYKWKKLLLFGYKISNSDKD